MRIAVVTASIGEKRRVLYDPLHVDPEIEYIMFTDRPLAHPIWKCTRVFRTHADPCMDAKKYKVLIHEHVAADASVWIDRRCRLTCDVRETFQENCQDLLLVEHTRRDCAYQEYEACLRGRKDSPEKLQATAEMLRQQNWPEGAGLYFGGILFRRHTERSVQFNRIWWDLIESHSRRDQIVLPLAVVQSGVPTGVLKHNRNIFRIGRQ